MVFFSPAAVIALIGGVTICFQSLFSGVMGSKVGVFESVFIVHAGGMLIAGVIVALLRGGNLGAWNTAPWYTLTAGLLGVVIVASISYAVPRIGLASTLTWTIVAQLTFGAILDHFGLLGAVQRSFDPPRIVGLLALAIGTWLVVR